MDGDEALTIIAIILFIAGIVLVTQIGKAPTEGQKGSRQTAAAIFIMASVAVGCIIVGKGLGRSRMCLPK